MIVDAKGTVYEQLRFLRAESYVWWTGAIAVAVAHQEAMNMEGGW
jgi:hypothetical protein